MLTVKILSVLYQLEQFLKLKLCAIFYRNLGCGGYIVNTGKILKPTYPPSENSSAECVWYIENTGSGNTILLTSQSKAIVPFPIIVSILFFVCQKCVSFAN
jgi:hypothetical protein